MLRTCTRGAGFELPIRCTLAKPKQVLAESSALHQRCGDGPPIRAVSINVFAEDVPIFEVLYSAGLDQDG